MPGSFLWALKPSRSQRSGARWPICFATSLGSSLHLRLISEDGSLHTSRQPLAPLALQAGAAALALHLLNSRASLLRQGHPDQQRSLNPNQRLLPNPMRPSSPWRPCHLGQRPLAMRHLTKPSSPRRPWHPNQRPLSNPKRPSSPRCSCHPNQRLLLSLAPPS